MIFLRYLHMVWGLLPLALLLRAPFLLARLAGQGSRRSPRPFQPLHEAGALLFLWYLFVVLSMTVNLPRVLAGQFSMPYDYNFTPLAGIAAVVSTGSRGYIWANLLGNVLLLAPLGLLLPLLWRGWARWYRTIPALALLSLAVETLQFFTGRTADVDDLILNAAGAALGYLAYVCLRLCVPRLAARFRLGRYFSPGPAGSRVLVSPVE